jgi:hypothetical protein
MMAAAGGTVHAGAHIGKLNKRLFFEFDAGRDGAAAARTLDHHHGHGNSPGCRETGFSLAIDAGLAPPRLSVIDIARPSTGGRQPARPDRAVETGET